VFGLTGNFLTFGVEALLDFGLSLLVDLLEEGLGHLKLMTALWALDAIGHNIFMTKRLKANLL
jgi:hypothetical protein